METSINRKHRMKYKTEGNRIWIHLLIYLIINFLAFSLSNLIVFDHFWMDGKSYPSLLLISGLSTLITYFLSRQNLINVTTQIPQLIWKNVEFIFLYILLVLMYWFAINSINYSKEQITLFFLFYFIFILGANAYYIRVLRWYKIDIPCVNTLVIGENKFTQQFIESIQENEWMGFKFIKKLVPEQFSRDGFAEFLDESKIDAVFINWDEFAQNEQREQVLRNIVEDKNIKFFAISEIFASKLIPSTYYLAGNFPYLNLYNFPLDNTFNITLKRLFDVFFALAFFVFIGIWLFPLIALINLFDSGFPIFFKQRRHGMDNIEFDCLKFRTMVVNTDSNDKITVKNDPRITKFGKILRKSSLDELPQFINVLKGDMSVVGPRPHMVNQNNHYNQIISKYNFRHYVKPGITGLAQVNGFRGEIKRDEDMENRIQSDLYYIRNWSFGLDLMIIYRTVANMIKGDKNAI